MSRHSALAVAYYVITVAVAMVMRVAAPIEGMAEFNPDWVLLVLIYWSIALPERFGVFSAWLVGLLTDVLTGRLLGQCALIYALTCYVSINEHRRLRQFPMLQQCWFVLVCLLGSQSIVFGIESFKAGNRLPLSFWYPAFSGAFAWPLVFYLLRYIRVRARIV